MDTNDSQAITSLFAKLAQVERQAPPRDAEAEAFIRDGIARQPGAPYFMAQTVIVQEQALNAAQARIEELERQAEEAPASGGLLGGLFGGGSSRSRGSVPSAGSRAGQPRDAGAAYGAQAASPWQRSAGGGGFLAGAAQTAMGVAGGVLLGNAIAGMFGADEANAAETDAQDTGTDDAGADDADFQDASADDAGGFDDLDI